MCLEIEQYSKSLEKYEKIRIDSWVRKISVVTNNQQWKKNRNIHAICLLDMLINNRVEEPYNRLPPDGPLPILNKTLVKSKLSKKIYNQIKYIYEPNSKPLEQLSPPDNNKNTKTKNPENVKLENYKINNNNKNLKIKRAKTPTMKKHNLDNLNISKNKINYGGNNNIFINEKNKSNYNYKNNCGKFSNNKNIIKECNNKYNTNNKETNKYNNNKKEYYDYKKVQQEENILDDNKIQLNILKETIFRLERELNKKEKIIELQREERVKLSLKVEELEKLLLSIIPKNTYY